MKKEITRNDVSRLFYIIILMVAPLYFAEGYYDIINAKTRIVWLGIFLTSVLALLIFIVWFYERVRNKNLKSSFLSIARQLIKSLKLIDVLVIIFGMNGIISALLSDYRMEALTGSEAWNVGGYMILALAVMYLLCSRCSKNEYLYLYAMMISAVAVMILGVLNDLWIDPLGIMANVDKYWKDSFTSTIGNIDQFSGYLSIVIPVMAMVFVSSTNGFKRAFAVIVLFFCYLNVFLTHADGIYVGVGFSFLFLIAYCLRNRSRFMGLLINGIIFGISGFAAQVVVLYRPEIRLDDISPILMGYNVHLIIGGCCFVLLLVQMALELKVSREKLDRAMNILQRIYIVLLILGALSAAVYVATNFSMDFMNRRGLLWYISVNGFIDGDLREKIIGWGPGTIDQAAVVYTFDIVDAYGGFYYLETAHNDIFEYLVTLGIVGVCSYAGIYLVIISGFVQMVRAKADFSAPSSYAHMGLIGYIGQSIMNGPHPLTTAMFFALLAVCRAGGVNGDVSI